MVDGSTNTEDPASIDHAVAELADKSRFKKRSVEDDESLVAEGMVTDDQAQKRPRLASSLSSSAQKDEDTDCNSLLDGINNDNSHNFESSQNSELINEVQMEPFVVSEPASDPESMPIKETKPGNWNSGVSSKLRVGFSRTLHLPTQNPKQSQSPITLPTKIVKRSGRSWNLPESLGGADTPWDTQVATWAEELARANGHHSFKLKTSDFQAIAMDFLDITLTKHQKKNCRAALMKYIRGGRWERCLDNLRKTLSPPSSPLDSHIQSDKREKVGLRADIENEENRGGEHRAVADLSTETEARSKDISITTDSDRDQTANQPIKVESSSSAEEGELTTSEPGTEAGSETQRKARLSGVDTDARLCAQEESRLKELCKYYPSSAICLTCSGSGHTRDSCPFRICRWCRKEDAHPYLACPLRRRCAKCKQLGHILRECTEKLKVVVDQPLRCKYCDKGHQDEECDLLFRVYFPDPEKANKIKHLPVQCYKCGTPGHDGTVCSYRTAPALPIDHVWSSEHRTVYIDANSENLPVAYRNFSIDFMPELPATFKPGEKIKGKVTHAEYTDGDDSDDADFLHLPASKPSAPRKIKISTNLQHSHTSFPLVSTAPGSTTNLPRFRNPPPVASVPVTPVNSNRGGRGGFSSLRSSRGGGFSGLRRDSSGSSRGGGKARKNRGGKY